MRRLGGASVSVLDQLGDAHQMLANTAAPTSISNLSRPFGSAPLHARPRKQHGDAALYATRNRWAFLNALLRSQGFLLGGLLSAPLRDAHLADLSVPAALHIVAAVEAAISGVTLGRVLEGCW